MCVREFTAVIAIMRLGHISILVDGSPSHHHRMTDDRVDQWGIMCNILLKEEKYRKQLMTRKKIQTPSSLCVHGAAWRWERWDAGRMDGLLRGRWGIALKSKVSRTGSRQLFQRMGNLEAGSSAHSEKALSEARVVVKITVKCHNPEGLKAFIHVYWSNVHTFQALKDHSSYFYAYP